MSTLLFLATDFIERMSDPAHGFVTNETYGHRYAQAATNEGFEKRLDEAIEALQASTQVTGNDIEKSMAHISNTNLFSIHGWTWVLRRAQSRKLKMNSDLMLILIKEFSTMLIQVPVIEVMSSAGSKRSISAYDRQPLSDWFKEIIKYISSIDNPQIESSGNELILARNSRRVETLLLSLIQAATADSMNTVTELLRTEWAGRGNLSRYLNDYIESLDPEIATAWRETLGL